MPVIPAAEETNIGLQSEASPGKNEGSYLKTTEKQECWGNGSSVEDLARSWPRV
jgi:hypothetical protein